MIGRQRRLDCALNTDKCYKTDLPIVLGHSLKFKRENLQTVTVKSRVEARVTIQKIKSLGCYKPRHVTKQDMLLFISSKMLDFEVLVSNIP